MRIEECFGVGKLTLSLHGELDHHAAGHVSREIERAADEHLPVSCVLDLSGVSFMDSSGIAVIIKARRRADELGASLRVVGVGRQPGRVLAAAGIGRIIDIEASRE
ncbi:MAG: STAS domain-containing protein [Oscillospiraceae bacterium]|jgi:stage II sporulation protein AA (anti-sigma F factor antagonist)|nr:STAS domain-containing protein [Oscillospiraceae bacterium]